jgi:hypothetical protein
MQPFLIEFVLYPISPRFLKQTGPFSGSSNNELVGALNGVDNHFGLLALNWTALLNPCQASVFCHSPTEILS